MKQKEFQPRFINFFQRFCAFQVSKLQLHKDERLVQTTSIGVGEGGHVLPPPLGRYTLIPWEKGKILMKTFFGVYTLYIWKYFILYVRANSFRPPPPLQTVLLSGFGYDHKYRKIFFTEIISLLLMQDDSPIDLFNIMQTFFWTIETNKNLTLNKYSFFPLGVAAIFKINLLSDTCTIVQRGWIELYSSFNYIIQQLC